ncbi:MAG: V-type ATPase subunit [Lachnospiraceae bacterium]|jgi:V/A-type H+-transporting ATPase subunit C|nr:V-type ATPase subunit [Lachnospiraceae bacterium]
MSETYAYAVARVRALEVGLLTNALIDQLIACRDYPASIQFLTEKGWGDSDTPLEAEAILGREEEKIWEVVKELAVDKEYFKVLSYPKLFHNLKAAIKEICTEEKHPHLFYDDAEIPGDTMLELIREKEFFKLPAVMQKCAQEAFETLLHTRDGQLCDIIIDRAALDAVYEAGKSSNEKIIKDYAESVVAVADIRIAVRAAKTGKTLDFLKRALAPCESISVDALAKAAGSGVDSLREYLSGTAYAEGAQALMVSPSAFERWCDNRVIETIKPQKYQSFTIGPVIAYVIARQNEIKTVRIVLSGKQNMLSEESIRERVREMYV